MCLCMRVFVRVCGVRVCVCVCVKLALSDDESNLRSWMELACQGCKAFLHSETWCLINGGHDNDFRLR